MTTQYPDGDARDRSEMKCPSCFTTGLEEKKKIAKLYDSTEEQIIYGTKCPNNNCDIGQIPPEEARAQLDTGISLSADSLLAVFREISFRSVTIVFGFFLLAGVLMLTASGLSIDLWGTGAASASAPYSNVSAAGELQDSSFEVYQESGNWTIYSYDGSFIVGGQINGSVTYLGPEGFPDSNPYYFTTLSQAQNAIASWESRHENNPSKYPAPDQPDYNLMTNSSGWGIFEHNGSFVVAGNHYGSVVYLRPNATFSETPFIYGNYSDARDALLEWKSRTELNPGEFPEIDPVTEEELETDLNNWDPDGGSWTPDDYDWDEEHKTIDDTNTSSVQETHSIQGTVYDSEENPVSGATVHLHSTHRTTVTDANGEYRFSDLRPGNHTIYILPPSGSTLAASNEVAFRMYGNGSIRVLGDPQNAVYFETSDGTIAKNQIELLAYEEQPIQAAGQGTDIATEVTFEQVFNAEGTQITLKGIHTESQIVKRIFGSDVTEEITTDGNAAPSDPVLLLTTAPESKTVSERGTYTGSDPTINIKGNQQAKDAGLTLNGRYSSNDKRSSRTLKWAKLNRNKDIINSYWLDGSEKTIFTAKREGDYRINVSWTLSLHEDENGWVDVGTRDSDGGNYNEIDQASAHQANWCCGGSAKDYNGYLTGTVHLEKGDKVVVDGRAYDGGNGYFNPKEDAVTLVGSKAHSVTHDIGGNIPATNANLRIDAIKGAVQAWDVPSMTAREGFDNAEDSGHKTIFTAPTNGTYKMTFVWKVEASTDVPGGGEASMQIKTSDGKTLLDKSADAVCHFEGPCYSEEFSGTDTFTVELEAGESVIKDYSIQGPAEADIYSRTDGIYLPGEDPGKVKIQVGGETYTTEYLSKGETTWVSLGELPSGTTTISFNPTNTDGSGRGISYGLTWTQRTGTLSPEAAIDGQTVCGKTGLLQGNLSCDIPSSMLEPGPTPINFTTESGDVSYNISYEARAVPENVTVEVNDQTYRYPEDFNSSIKNGTKYNLTSLKLGQNTVSINVTPVDGITTNVTAELRYKGESRQTADPVVTVVDANGVVHSKSVPATTLENNGLLYGNATMTLPGDWFSEGQNVIRVETSNASQVVAVVNGGGLKYQAGTFKTVSTVVNATE